MALMHVDFFSRVLGMATQMDVIIPQKNLDSYPTLYLLHGMSDDHTIWQRRTSIERYADDMNIAVVMPSTHLGWYTDMHHGLKYFTFMTDELPKICRDFFPKMSPKREDNFVAGLSMGGYGAFKLALGAPDVFCAAASLSGALDFTQNAPFKDEFWINIFGPDNTYLNSSNDLFELARREKASGKPLTKLYIWCGTEDFLYSQNQSMKAFLEKEGFDLTYEESSGDHQWKYWDEKIQTVLKWLPINK